MRTISQIIAATLIPALLAAPVTAQPATTHPPPAPAGREATPKPPPRATSFKITDSFTAQRRPRVTVLTFDDTNKGAQKAKYGPAVEAMLVTFLKRKSQFVVVERQKINTILTEKQRLQTGMVQAEADDETAQALLEKIDVFVLGSVTLLNLPSQPEGNQGVSKDDSGDLESAGDYSDEEEWGEDDTGEPSDDSAMSSNEILPEDSGTTHGRAEKWEDLGGPRVEIDAKLISRFDGRIIAAAQRSGPVACLRSIVERLGVALEQEYLRPYYGTLTVTLNEPEHIRLFLTPILPADALDEEKPPVERSTTVIIGGNRDTIEPWTTDPATYTIKSLLSGWYSMRIERPGYSTIDSENARWEVRRRQGKEVVYDRTTNLPLDKVPPEIRRFVVQVTPLTTDVLDIKSLRFEFIKEGGSFTPLAKRQYLDDNFSQGPSRVILLGGPKIALNRIDGPGEYADDPKCDLFVEETPKLTNYGRTYVTAGQRFDFDQFTGGELIIEDYRGEVVPVGRYTMVLWEPAYQIEQTQVTVRPSDKSSIKVSMIRETAELRLRATGPRPASRALLTGQATRHRLEVPLDFSGGKQLPAVPVDSYTAGTDITGLEFWSHGVELPATNLTPPLYDTASKRNQPRLLLRTAPPLETKSVPSVGVKTRFGLAGRLRVLSRRPDPLAADLYIDRDIAKVLNLLLYGVADRPEDKEDIPSLEEAVAQAGRDPLSQTVYEVDLAGGPSQKKTKDKQPPPAPRPTPEQETEGTQPPDGRPEAGTTAPADQMIPGQKPVTTPQPNPYPKDPEALRTLLAERLEVVDLLILDPVDMAQLRQSPEVAGIISRWVSGGGSLFAFVSSPGDYLDIVGAPLSIDSMSKRTKRFELAPGKVPGVVHLAKKKVKSKGRRQLPELSDLDRAWRVLAYTRESKWPRIIEKGTRGQGGGGYVVLWFDDPEAFRGPFGGTRPEVEQTRANVEEHVFKWSRNLMRARFGGGLSEPAGRATSPGH